MPDNSPDMTVRERFIATPRQWLWRSMSLLLAAALIAFMLSLVDWAAFWEVLRRLSPTSLLAAFVVYVLLNAFRALRYRVLLRRDDLPFAQLFPLGLWHNFLVRLLPFKLGELAYIVLLRQRLAVPMREGVSSLFGARLLELLVIVLVATGSLLISESVVALGGSWVLLLMAGSIVAGVLGLYYAGTLVRGTVRLLRRLTALPLVERLCERLTSLAIEFDRLRDPRIFTEALFWSVFTYACSFGVNAILLAAIGIEADIPTLIVLVSLGMFATAFPLNISGFGAVELSWALGLTALLGYSTGEATSIGLMLNGYQLLCAAVSGVAGWLVMQMQPQSSLPE